MKELCFFKLGWKVFILQETIYILEEKKVSPRGRVLNLWK
jgi:hypothetical protein